MARDLHRARCRVCGGDVAVHDRFCRSCGVALEGETETSERRLVSICFVDLVAFTRIAAEWDAEEVRGLLDRYYARARRVVEALGGRLEKFAGDAVMAVWGAPVSREDDAEHAVAAALALLDEVVALGVEQGLDELRARAGVATGYAAARLGAAGQALVAGGIVTTAARIQQAASPGELMLDDATRRAAGPRFAYRDAGHQSLRGRPAVERLWRVLRGEAGQGVVDPRHREPLLVGRDAALAALERIVSSALATGRPHAGLVVGPAASGKTRLLAELERRVARDGRARWLALDAASERAVLERAAAAGPAVVVVDDAHDAGAALLDAVTDVLGRSWPVAVLLAGRPEVGSGAWTRLQDTERVVLEPLDEEAMDALLRALAPGLAAADRAAIGRQAEGMPGYATAIVRLLQDRGQLRGQGERHTGTLDEIDVPEALHAQVAARLDLLEQDEREVLRSCAVVGRSFTVEAVAAVSGRPPPQVAAVLDRLRDRRLLVAREDAGHAFAQDLVRRVAYETLPRARRRTGHLAAAAQCEAGLPAPDAAGAVAHHLAAAAAADPAAPDAAALRGRARDLLVAAGRDAERRGEPAVAERCFTRAAALESAPAGRAPTLRAAGQAARRSGRMDEAERLLTEALAAAETAGDEREVALATALLARARLDDGHPGEAAELLRGARSALAAQPGADLARVEAELARALLLLERHAEAVGHADAALRLAEELDLVEVTAEALNTKGILLVLGTPARYHEGQALLRHALTLAGEHDLTEAALRAGNNLGFALQSMARHREAEALFREQLDRTRRCGDQQWEWFTLAQLAVLHKTLGDWDAAVRSIRAIPEAALDSGPLPLRSSLATLWVSLCVERGDLAEARAFLDRCDALRTSEDPDDAAILFAATAALRWGQGRLAETVALTEQAVDALPGEATDLALHSIVWYGVEAALELGELERAETVVAACERRPAGTEHRDEQLQHERFRALVSAARDDEGAGAALTAVTAALRDADMVFQAAVTAVDHAAWALRRGAAAGALARLDEAEPALRRMGAVRRLERVRALRADARSA